MTTMITVEGVTCSHCEQTVEEALQDVSGVTVDRENEQATVNGDADATALVEAVEDAGYTAHI